MILYMCIIVVLDLLITKVTITTMTQYICIIVVHCLTYMITLADKEKPMKYMIYLLNNSQLREAHDYSRFVFF